MLLRIGNMRGVDLSIFDFDYDLQWFALMLSADGEVLGRFGGRDADTPAKYQTLAGLRHSLESALIRFQKGEPSRLKRMPMFAEDYAAAEKLAGNSCIHCHHVHEFHRDALKRQGRWSIDEAWIYPQPENIGLTLDLEQGDRIAAVQPKSPAAIAGLRAKDVLRRVNDTPIASIADLQFALNRAPKQGELTVVWNDGNIDRKALLPLPKDWRRNDVSWRWSLKSLSPSPGIIGDDLDANGRKLLGLDAHQLAYRQMNYLTPAARHAGLRTNDVIVGIGDEPMNMTARQFETHIRLHYEAGDEITLNVLRGKERVKLRLKLAD